MVKKLIIIGNGFDLAHNFPTSYKDFRKAYSENEHMQRFEEFIMSIHSEFGDNTKWYEFESSIEKAASIIFSKQFDDVSNPERYFILDKEMEKCNTLFEEIKELLKIYLTNVTQNKKIQKKESLIKEFESNQVYVVSFNYTDIVKCYSNQVDYVHGSLSDDLDIILGYSNDIPPMDLANGPYIRYMKEVQKFKLKYLRFLKANGDTEKYKERLEEFQPHLDCLFSGKGGWAFPLKKFDGRLDYDVSNASYSLLKFCNINKELHSNLFDKFKNVQELVIMGHGLESDELFFRALAENINHLNKIILYTFSDEEKKELVRKKQMLVHRFGVKEITIKFYD